MTRFERSTFGDRYLRSAVCDDREYPAEGVEAQIRQMAVDLENDGCITGVDFGLLL